MPSSGDGIRLRSSARTSVGQVRENNEDSVHLWPGDKFLLAVVADGMGGAAAGEEASQMAIEAIQAGMSLQDQDGQKALEKVSDAEISRQLRDAIQNANLSIMQRAAEEPEMRGMGTTVTLAFVRGKDVVVAHVGDSRAYRVDGMTSNITQITADHSFVEALLAAGHITPEQADDHPMRNVLYRALGQAEDVDIDLYQSQLQVGDRLVLCSDGLTRHVKPEEIAQVALKDNNPETSSQNLIDMANDRGGEDNVSVIVIAVEQEHPGMDSDKSEIAFAAEEDEEDTLIFKDRPFSRADLTRITEESKAQQPPEPPAEESADVSESTSSLKNGLSKQKMRAERISDTVEVPVASPYESPVPAFEPASPVSDPQPPRKTRDSEGEGLDTRIPEQ